MNTAQSFSLRYQRFIQVTALTVGLVIFCVHPVFAAAGINKQINFQGKLVNSDGTNVANGSGYEIVFRLYNASTGGTAVWTETQTGVSVTDGLFRVALGSVTSLSTVDFNNDSLYLSMQITKDATGAATTDLEMDPRIRFSSAAYAFNAEKVNGLTVTNTSDNPFSSATTLKIGDGKTVIFNNGLTFSGTDSTTFTFPTTSDTVVTLAATQTLTNKTIGSTGLVFSGASTDISTASNEVLTLTPSGTGNVLINPNSGGQAALIVDKQGDNDIFTASAAGQTKFTIASSGNITDTAATAINFSNAALTVASCSGCGGAAGTNYWNLVSGNGVSNGGYLSPVNATADLLLGGTATSSAKFAVLNMIGSGTPTASLSAQSGTYKPALILGSDGTIQSMNMNTLTLGGSSTGDISFKPGNAATPSLFLQTGGNVGIGVTNPADALTIKKPGSEVAQFFNTTVASSAYIQIGSNLYNNWFIGKDVVGAGNDNFMLKGIDSNTVLTLTQTGNFGIGTTSPTNALYLTHHNTLGVTGKALAIFDQYENQDIFTASASGSTVFTLSNSGNITDTAATAINFSNAALTVASCSGCGGASGTNYWNLVSGNGVSNGGYLSPINATADLLLGGTATSSAKFAVLNMTGNGTPTASLSAQTGIYKPALILGSDGTIQSMNMNSLTVGGSTTGDIAFKPGNASTPSLYLATGGNVGIGVSNPTAFKLQVAGNIGPNADKTNNLGNTTHRFQTLYLSGNGSGTSAINFSNGSDAGAIFLNTQTLTQTGTNVSVNINDSNYGGVGEANSFYVTSGSQGGSSTEVFDLDSTGSTQLNVNNGSITSHSSGFGVSGHWKGNALAIFNETGSNDIFTASAAGQTKFTIASSGNITDTAATAINFSNAALTVASCSGCGGTSGTNYWNLVSGNGVSNGGYISPINATADLLLGGTATSSAKFAVLNMTGNGTPTASIAAQTGTYKPALILGSDGTIQSMNMNTLTMGGSTTGNIVLDSGSSLIQLLDPTTIATNQQFPFKVTDNSASKNYFTIDGVNGVNVGGGTAGYFTVTPWDTTPTMDIMQISNSGNNTTTTGYNGLTVNFANGGSSVIDNAGVKINLNSTNNISGTNLEALDIANTINRPSSTEIGIRIGSNLDKGLVFTAAESTYTVQLASDAGTVASGITFGTSSPMTIYKSASGQMTIGDGTNGLVLDASTGPAYQAGMRPTKTITLSPEFAGAVLTASGSASSSTNGSMTSDASNSASLGWRNYYQWTSSQTSLQNYTVAVEVTLPKDFSDWVTTNALQINFNTALTTTDTNKLDVTIYNTTDSTATPVVYRQSQVSGTAKTWTTVNVDRADLIDTPTWNTAGQRAVIYLKMSAKDNNYVQVGSIQLNYLSKF